MNTKFFRFSTSTRFDGMSIPFSVGQCLQFLFYICVLKISLVCHRDAVYLFIHHVLVKR